MLHGARMADGVSGASSHTRSFWTRMTDFEEGSLLVIRLVTLCLEAGWYSWLRAAAISVIMLSHCKFKRTTHYSEEVSTKTMQEVLFRARIPW